MAAARSGEFSQTLESSSGKSGQEHLILTEDQQTFIATYTKVAFVKLYDRKNAMAAADMLNDRVLPFFEEHHVPLLRVLTDRGTEYCGNRESHEYQLY